MGFREVNVLVLAFHPMHAVTLANPLQFGAPIQLESRFTMLRIWVFVVEIHSCRIARIIPVIVCGVTRSH